MAFSKQYSGKLKRAFFLLFSIWLLAIFVSLPDFFSKMKKYDRTPFAITICTEGSPMSSGIDGVPVCSRVTIIDWVISQASRTIIYAMIGTLFIGMITLLRKQKIRAK